MQQENKPKYDILMEYFLTKLPSYQLTIQQVEWIYHYFEKSPETLKQIVEQIENIVSDGVINVEDIPEIIKCISTIYHERSLLMNMTELTNIILLIRYTLDCMIETDMIVTNYFEKKTLEFVVNSSLDLLQYQFVLPSVTPITKTTEENTLDTPKTEDIETEDETCCTCLSFYFHKK